mmetsp:Transcript_57944/g.67623  ORF Transcript_57944/g.67623 Transcript_57944/m.67623 type:complete len:233 (+) Transcript_57944:153-851(+)
MAAFVDGSSVTLTADVVRASSVAVYKVVGGEAGTLVGYNDSCLATADAGSLEQVEWRGLYTQLKRDHVLGTIPYRWERGGNTAARLVRATFEDLTIVVLDGPMMHDGGISGGDKALAAKVLLGIDPTLPLLAALGERRQVCLVRETEDEWELVIPHALLQHLSMRETGVARFRKHPSMPITHRWQPEEQPEGTLEPWEDGTPPAKALSLIPDLDLPAISSDSGRGGGETVHP